MGTAAPVSTNWITDTSSIGHPKWFAIFGNLTGVSRFKGVRFVQVLAAIVSAYQPD